MSPREALSSGFGNPVWWEGLGEKKYNVSIGKDPQSVFVLESLLKNEKLKSCLFFMLPLL